MTNLISIPAITTDRLTLRAFANPDLEAFAEIVADPEVMRYATYTGEPMSRGQAWNWICLMLGHWQLREYGIWAIEERDTGQLLGRIGLQYLDWFDDVELVWMLKRSAWGQGYASEATQAAVQYGFETIQLTRITAIIHLGNVPSIGLAERLGMSFERQIERQGIQFLEYALEKEQQD